MSQIKFKLAMGQMSVRTGRINENLNLAEQMIQAAKQKGCSVIVLPECLDIGWTNPAAGQLAQPVPGSTSERLCNAAEEWGIYTVAGLTERDGNCIYNAAILISPQGEILLKHRKINTLTIEQDIYSTGDRLSVVETELGRIGVNTCADNFPNCLVLGHCLARMGADILLSPCSWAVVAEHDNEKDPYGADWTKPYSRLAKLYDMTVVGVSNVGWIEAGVWQGHKCIGCSLAIGPGGKILARGPYGVEAQQLVEVPVEIIPRRLTGTAISDMLSEKCKYTDDPLG